MRTASRTVQKMRGSAEPGAVVILPATWLSACSRGLRARRVHLRRPAHSTSDDLSQPPRSAPASELGSLAPARPLFYRSRHRRIDMPQLDSEYPVENDAKSAKILEDIAERPHTPPRRDLSFYIVLIVAVIPLWSAVPLSWAFVLYSLRSGNIWSYAWKGQILFAFALVEVRYDQVNLVRSRSYNPRRCSSVFITII